MTAIEAINSALKILISDLLSLVGDQPAITVTVKSDEVHTGRVHLAKGNKGTFYALVPVADLLDADGNPKGKLTKKDITMARTAKGIEDEKVRLETMLTRIKNRAKTLAKA